MNFTNCAPPPLTNFTPPPLPAHAPPQALAQEEVVDEQAQQVDKDIEADLDAEGEEEEEEVEEYIEGDEEDEEEDEVRLRWGGADVRSGAGGDCVGWGWGGLLSHACERVPSHYPGLPRRSCEL